MGHCEFRVELLDWAEKDWFRLDIEKEYGTVVDGIIRRIGLNELL